MAISDQEAKKLDAQTRLFEVQTQVEEAKLWHVNRELAQQASQPDDARIFTFYGPVEAESVGRCIFTLDTWSRRYPNQDITVIFNSPGGNVLDGFALFDFLLELKTRGHKIITKAIGMAASMGATLLQAGDERVIGPHSFLMIHETGGGLDGIQRSSEIDDFSKLLTKFETKGLDILSERSTLSRQQIKNRWKRKDWWLDAEEALTQGFVDRIG